MDIKITQSEKDRIKRKFRIRAGIIVLSFAALLTLIILVLNKGISSEDLEIAVVDKGPVEVSVYSSGKIVPLYQETVTSPISSKVLSVEKKAGDRVSAGDTLLKLDLKAVSTDLEKQKDEVEMKKNKLEQYKTDVESRLADLKMQIGIDQMRLKRQEVVVDNERYLDSIGASTMDRVRQVELEYEVQKLQFEQLKVKYEKLQLTSAMDIRVYELDYNIAKNNLDLKEKMMNESQILAPISGTVTWINDVIGANVSAGGQLAVISDLNAYRVDAEVSDSYGDKVKSGNKVEIKMGNDKINGKVLNVTPAVSEGLIKFAVELDDRNHQGLRSGLQVDVFVIHSVKDDALRLPNRTFYMGKGDYELWVVEGKTARKRKVILGENSADFIEIISGVSEREKVIVSGMNKYTRESKLRVE